MAMTDAQRQDAAEEVEVLSAVGVPGPGAFAFREDDGLLVVVGDTGEEEFLVLAAHLGRFHTFHFDVPVARATVVCRSLGGFGRCRRLLLSHVWLLSG